MVTLSLVMAFAQHHLRISKATFASLLTLYSLLTCHTLWAEWWGVNYAFILPSLFIRELQNESILLGLFIFVPHLTIVHRIKNWALISLLLLKRSIRECFLGWSSVATSCSSLSHRTPMGWAAFCYWEDRFLHCTAKRRAFPQQNSRLLQPMFLHNMHHRQPDWANP